MEDYSKLSGVLSLYKAAVKTAMQCLYWLVKEDIPHTTNYPSLLNAVEFMGCTQLKHLQCSENAKYCKSGNFWQCNIFGKQRKTLFGREKFLVPHALPL